jgi:hypothetical protein
MEEIPEGGGSNRRLIILLIILVAVFLILVGVWKSGLSGGKDDSPATTTAPRIYKPLTEEEKREALNQSQTIMLQFATSTGPSREAAAVTEQENLKIMELFAPVSPVISTKESKENYEIMKLFQ